jgi:soluble lytic murein transglycosylase-like protein
VFSPPEKVIRWRSIVDHWCVELQVSQSLVLAVIQQESGGDEKAHRYEPAYERRYILNNRAWIERCREIGITSKQAATSYGLMQLMFPTAWGFGCRHPDDLYDPDQNIRFGTALLASKLKKYSIEETLAAYNGGDGAVKDLVTGKVTAATKYSDKVFRLYQQYREYMKATRP